MPVNQTITGIQVQHQREAAVQVYPNPASDKVTIDANGKILEEIQLFYADGRLVELVKPLRSTHTFHLGELHNGVYFMRIISENENTVTRLILSH